MERVRRYLWTTSCDLGMRPLPSLCRPFRRGRLHHRRLLVYRLYFICQPAVTLARAFTNTFAGIRLVDVFPFMIVQFAGALAATALFRWLLPILPQDAEKVVVTHPEEHV